MREDQLPEGRERPPGFGIVALGFALLSLLAIILCGWGIAKVWLAIVGMGTGAD